MDHKGATTTLVTLSLMLVLVNYVETMVIPALPKIEDQFSTSATTVAWITSAYLIVGAVASPVFGKLGDRYGKKKIYLLAIAFYSLAVLIAGFSTNIYMLIFARAIQGLGFAVFPIAIAIITDLFPRERVAWAQSILSATLALGPALGLLIGAYIVQDLGWQYAFHTAFILSIILMFISIRFIQEIPSKTKERIDYLGAVFLMLAVISLLVYLTEGPSIGWFSATQFSLILTSIISFGVFIFVERRVAEPLMKLDLFRIRNIMVANISGLIAGTAMFLMFIGLTYYAQLPKPYGLGLSIIDSGLLMAPVALTMMVVGPIVGRLINSTGPKPLLIFGSIVGIIGFLLLNAFNSTNIQVLLDTVVASVGIISLMIPLVNMVAVSLPEDQRGVGIGMNTLIRSIGSSVGPVISTVFMDTYTAWIGYLFNNQYLPIASVPSSEAFHYIYLVGICLMFINLLVALLTKNYVLKQKVKTTESVV
ncbi:MFS transporter [Sulfolobus acidocaldarius]|nr:MFS transporter [Sulfolobus acidocaldarius]AGE71118.1 multidrug resistance protein [Sulfolobus acidocaldarius N8]AGE73388.1 multidrug resistance protein [Sulfolobus acidocaldarius Ron12/I]ALU28607.1 MFS transporter [Sulfolobus acidocaldarius]ALU31321.1 MFS transporter [Sulfolobus acidocaldarius]WCM35054.1 MFS transporter [Sulfolobus acidocaldarius DSM 639]